MGSEQYSGIQAAIKQLEAEHNRASPPRELTILEKLISLGYSSVDGGPKEWYPIAPPKDGPLASERDLYRNARTGEIQVAIPGH